MARVLIGAAHTLETPGQIFGDLKEAELTRQILKLTIPHLENLKIEFKAVPLDLPLFDRIEWINNTGFTEENGDIFVEIHINDGGKRGIESWYKGNASSDNKSQILAETLNELISKKTKYQNQGAKSEHVHDLGSLFILNQIKSIGTTIELLYIDNEEDIKILKDEKQLDELAKALAESIKEYLDNTPKESSTKTKSEESQPQSTPNSVFGNSAFNPSSIFGQNKQSTFQPKNSMPMDREERKKMIKELNLLVLGKEISQAELNLQVNQGLTKEELVIKLIESEEHKKIVKDSQELKEAKDKLQKIELELQESNLKKVDMESTVENFNKLLHHKNTFIAQLQSELVQKGLKKNGEYFNPNSSNTTDNSALPSTSFPKKRKTISELIMKIIGV